MLSNDNFEDPEYEKFAEYKFFEKHKTAIKMTLVFDNFSIPYSDESFSSLHNKLIMSRKNEGNLMFLV